MASGVVACPHSAWLLCRLFHERRLEGQPVITHAQLVEFLVNKAPAARVARLPFEGQNTCVYLHGAACTMTEELARS